jgi:hypothetical protein
MFQGQFLIELYTLNDPYFILKNLSKISYSHYPVNNKLIKFGKLLNKDVPLFESTTMLFDDFREEGHGFKTKSARWR